MKFRLHSFHSVFKGHIAPCLVLLFALSHSSLEAAEPQFATPQARAVWGAPLNAQLELGQIGLEAATQLNDQCMHAWLETLGGSTEQAAGGLGRVLIKYIRTTGDRGLLNVQSEMDLKEPVVRLVLESRCPLVEFSRAWVFQVDMGSARAPGVSKATAAMAQGREQSGELKDFDVRASSELVHSFIRPKLVVRSSVRHADLPAAPVRTVAQALEPTPADSKAQAADKVQPDTQGKLVRIHSQEASTVGAGMTPPAMKPGAQSPGDLLAQSSFSAAGNDWTGTAGLTLGVLTLLLLGSGLWWMKRRQGFGLGQGVLDTSKLKSAAPSPVKHTHSHLWLTEEIESSPALDSEGAEGLAEDDSSALFKRQGQDADAMSKQFFESLLGLSKAQDLMGDTQDSTRDMAERVGKRSATEQLIHTVSLGPWVLPESYSPLLPGHLLVANDSNRSEASNLHLELNLIELAFIGAQEHRHVDEGEVGQLIEAHCARSRAPLASEGSSHEPSDLIRDFLRARACEFKSRADLEEFQSALLRMADFPVCRAYCMGHANWAECVQDLTLA